MSKEIRESLGKMLGSWPFSGSTWQRMLRFSRLTLFRRYQLAKSLENNSSWDFIVLACLVLQLLVFMVGFFFIYGGFDTLHHRNGIDPGTSRGAALVMSGIIVSWVGAAVAWFVTICSRRLQRSIGIAEGLLEANQKPEKKPTSPKDTPTAEGEGKPDESKEAPSGTG